MSSPFPGPVPPFNNVPIEPENYKPRRFQISAIALGQTTTVTTTVDLDYVIGQLVRLLIPYGYGCVPLDQQEGIVISIPANNQVELAITSLNMTPFFDNPVFSQKAQIVAVGDYNSGAINTQGRVNNTTYIPGSFINISNT